MDVKIIVETRSQMKRLIEQLRNTTGQNHTTDIGKRERWRMIFGTLGVARPDEDENSDPIFITTRDISEVGLGFMTRRVLEPGRQLVVDIETDEGEIEVVGTVVHCTRSVGEMMKIGLKFNLRDE